MTDLTIFLLVGVAPSVFAVLLGMALEAREDNRQRRERAAQEGGIGDG
jgi:hypothetical protein